MRLRFAASCTLLAEQGTYLEAEEVDLLTRKVKGGVLTLACRSFEACRSRPPDVRDKKMMRASYCQDLGGDA